MRRSVFGCYAMLIVTAQMAGGEELRPERLRVLVPELPREYRPTEVARVFGSLAVAKHSNAVSPATGLRTVVFLDTANASARELVCTLAEWMAVPALQAPETPVFTSGGFSFPGFQTVPSPDQNYTVVADPDVFRRTVSDLCREARAMRPMKAWGLDYYRPTYSDSRPAFWNWLRTQPPTRVFWISRSFGWMEPIVEWVDDGTGNYGISASADESEWVWVRRLPGLSQHAIFPIFMSGVVQESRPIPDAQNPEQPQPARAGPVNSATEPSLPPPPRPRGSERRDYRHALQFAGWFGGAVYEAKSRAGDALAEALRDSERMRLVDFSVLCPPRGKPLRGPVAVAMPGFPRARMVARSRLRRRSEGMA